MGPKSQQRWEERLRSHRAYREAEHLFAQALARTVFGTLLLAVRDLLLTWALVLLFDALLGLALPAPQCLRDCFRVYAAPCCAAHSVTWLRLSGLVVMIALGSLIGTCWVKRRAFQHSAILNVMVLASVYFFALPARFPLWMQLSTLLAAFFAGYAGLKGGLALRRRRAAAVNGPDIRP